MAAFVGSITILVAYAEGRPVSLMFQVPPASVVTCTLPLVQPTYITSELPLAMASVEIEAPSLPVPSPVRSPEIAVQFSA